jgi:hypothetical protein
MVHNIYCFNTPEGGCILSNAPTFGGGNLFVFFSTLVEFRMTEENDDTGEEKQIDTGTQQAAV